jgi:hypothetical protein
MIIINKSKSHVIDANQIWWLHDGHGKYIIKAQVNDDEGYDFGTFNTKEEAHAMLIKAASGFVDLSENCPCPCMTKSAIEILGLDYEHVNDLKVGLHKLSQNPGVVRYQMLLPSVVGILNKLLDNRNGEISDETT